MNEWKYNPEQHMALEAKRRWGPSLDDFPDCLEIPNEEIATHFFNALACDYTDTISGFGLKSGSGLPIDDIWQTAKAFKRDAIKVQQKLSKLVHQFHTVMPTIQSINFASNFLLNCSRSLFLVPNLPFMNHISDKQFTSEPLDEGPIIPYYKFLGEPLWRTGQVSRYAMVYHSLVANTPEILKEILGDSSLYLNYLLGIDVEDRIRELQETPMLTRAKQLRDYLNVAIQEMTVYEETLRRVGRLNRPDRLSTNQDRNKWLAHSYVLLYFYAGKTTKPIRPTSAFQIADKYVYRENKSSKFNDIYAQLKRQRDANPENPVYAFWVEAFCRERWDRLTEGGRGRFNGIG